jgi:hypothetical protein
MRDFVMQENPCKHLAKIRHSKSLALMHFDAQKVARFDAQSAQRSTLLRSKGGYFRVIDCAPRCGKRRGFEAWELAEYLQEISFMATTNTRTTETRKINVKVEISERTNAAWYEVTPADQAAVDTIRSCGMLGRDYSLDGALCDFARRCCIEHKDSARVSVGNLQVVECHDLRE